MSSGNRLALEWFSPGSQMHREDLKAATCRGPVGFWRAVCSSAGSGGDQQQAGLEVTSGDPGQAGEELDHSGIRHQSLQTTSFECFGEINSAFFSILIFRLDLQSHGGANQNFDKLPRLCVLFLAAEQK